MKTRPTQFHVGKVVKKGFAGRRPDTSKRPGSQFNQPHRQFGRAVTDDPGDMIRIVTIQRQRDKSGVDRSATGLADLRRDVFP